MSDQPRGWTNALVRGWTRLYTAGARHEARDARRALIECDLWEHHADAAASGVSSRQLRRELISRMLRSIPADLAWRVTRGGLEFPPVLWVERGAGVLMLLMVVLFVGAVGGPGLSGDEPYFSEDFPAFADNPNSVMRTIAFRLAVGIATALTAVLLFQTFRRQSPLAAALAGLALVAGGVLFLGSALATLEVHRLAGDWLAGGRIAGDETWLAARDQASLQESLGFLGILSLGIGFAGLGFIVARSGVLPRPLAWPAIGGGLLLVASIPLWSAGDWGWMVSMLGTASLAVPFLLTAGWLTLRGTRAPSRI